MPVQSNKFVYYYIINSISIKKPNGQKKESQDIFNPFDVNQPTNTNKQQQAIGDINDIFGSKPSGGESKTSVSNANTSVNNNSLGII